MNGRPKYIDYGIHDMSILPTSVEQAEFGQHLIKAYVKAQKGGYEPRLATGSKHFSYFGSETFNVKSKFYNPSTLFLEAAMKDSVTVVQRMNLLGSGAKVTHYIDILADKVDVAGRTPSGKIDQTADPIATDVAGLIVKHIAVEEETGSIREGTMVDADGNKSKMYPLFSFTTFDGEYYNSLGYNIVPSRSLTKAKVIENEGFVYDFKMLRKDKGLIKIFKTLFSATTTKIALNELEDSLTGMELGMDKAVPYAYYNNINPDKQWRDPEVETVLYPDMVELVQSIIAKSEQVFTDAQTITDSQGNIVDIDTWFDATGENLVDHSTYVNVISFASSSNVPYFTVKVDNTPVEKSVGVSGNYQSNFFLSGGLDSKPADIYNEEEIQKQLALLPDDASDEDKQAVRDNYVYLTQAQVDDVLYHNAILVDLGRYLDENDDYQEIALHPESFLYDPGYPLDIKEAMCGFISVRGDNAVMISTYITTPDGKNELSLAEQIAIGSIIKAKLNLFAESITFGTKVARGFIAGGSCVVKNHPWKGRVPTLYSVLYKASAYMGAATKVWNKSKSFDAGDASAATEIMDIKPKSVNGAKDVMWSIGINWLEPLYTEKVYHWPAFATVADDNTVLNSLFTMAACLWICKEEIYSWKRNSGESRLSPAAFLNKVRVELKSNLSGKFDGRFVLVPRVVLDNVDKKTGYSWTQDVAIYANDMYTVARNSRTTYRKSSL